MRALQATDLWSLEAYAAVRRDFRAGVLAHKRRRRLALGAHASLLFEDRLTVHYQVQEMLRIERIVAPDQVQQELDAYNPLIPDGSDLRALLMLEYADPGARRAAMSTLGGIGGTVHIEVEGRSRAQTEIEADAQRDHEAGVSDRAAAVQILRFVFDHSQITALREGAAVHVVIDDARMPVRVEIPPQMRGSLLADFD